MMVPTSNPIKQDQFQQQHFQMLQHQQQFQMQQQQQFQMQQQQFQIQQQQQQQQQLQQSIVSQFNFFHLIENLVEVLETGARDQHSDALVNELGSQMEKCQSLLNTISSSLNTKNVTVESQKQKLEETEQLLFHRRDLVAKYRSSVQDLLNPDNTI